MREAVLTALDVLGYERPTKLRGERARLVGLVLPELQNPIFPAFAEVVGGALAQQGFTPVLCTQTAGGVSESAYVELLLTQQVSGIVFAGGNYAQRDAGHGHYQRLTARNMPVVLINASIDELAFPRVSCDDQVAIEQSIGHLAALGHTRIGLVLGPDDHVPSERKLAAARMVCQRVGIELPRPARRAGRHTRSKAARPRPPGCCGKASPASCARRTRWRWAPSEPPGGSGYRCRRTSRSSATTTRPS